MTGRQFVEVSCVIPGDQSEIGGAGGGLTGEQVDGTHWPAPTGQWHTRFHFSSAIFIKCKISQRIDRERCETLNQAYWTNGAITMLIVFDF